MQLCAARKEETMADEIHRVCPVENTGSLESRFRRWIHHPQKIIAPYVEKGMSALDFGCDPGFFSIELAWMG